MHFYHYCCYDRGDRYEVNQDSLSLQTLMTEKGPVAMALICDGVGGLRSGEVACNLAAKAMTVWFYQSFIPMYFREAGRSVIYKSFQRKLEEVHEQLKEKGKSEGGSMGTTLTMLLLYDKKYLVFQIGDSGCDVFLQKRKKACYKTLTSAQRNEDGMLLQAIGCGEVPIAECVWGRQRFDGYFLYSDGLHNTITKKQSEQLFHIKGHTELLPKRMEELLSRVRRNGEKDNCSGIVLLTVKGGKNHKRRE